MSQSEEIPPPGRGFQGSALRNRGLAACTSGKTLGMPRHPYRQSSVLFEALANRLELRRFPRVAPLGAARPQKRGGEGPTGRNGRGMRGSPGRRRGAAHSTWEVARSRLFLAERCRTSIKNVDFSI